jgi:hypothetical protein
MCALLGLRLPLFALFCPALVPRHSSSLQIVKSAFHPDKVRRHWDNPWIFNTFGFVPIVWIVLTVLLGEEIDKAAYSVLIVRTTLQLIEMGHAISVCVCRLLMLP